MGRPRPRYVRSSSKRVSPDSSMCEGNQMRFMPRLVLPRLVLRRLVLPRVVLPRIVAVSSLATLIVAVTLVVPGEPAVAVVPSVWMVANSVATGDQDAPAVAANRVVSPAGSVIGSGYANASTAGQQLAPKVSVDPDGAPGSTTAVAFTVVWEDIQGTAAATVKAAGFTGTATKAYEITVNQTGGSDHR